MITKSRLFILVSMQIKEKLDFSFLKSFKKTLFKVVAFVLTFGLLTYGLSVAFTMIAFLAGMKISVTILNLLLVAMQLFSLIACTDGLTKALYMADDSVLLLSFPVRPNEVFVSKLLVFYIYELRKNILFFLCPFIAFGIYSNGLPFYYVMLLLIYIFLPLLPVLFGSLLSFVVMLIKGILKSSRILMIGFLLTLFVGAFYLSFYLAAFIPESFRIIGQWATIYKGILAFADLVASKTFLFVRIIEIPLAINFWQNLGLFMLVLGGLALTTYLISRPLYFMVASKPMETKNRKSIKKKKNHDYKYPYIGYVKKELFSLIRQPETLVSNYLFLFLSPIIIFFINTLYASMPVDSLGKYMQIAFNLLVLIVIITSSNTASADAFSKEGRKFYLTKIAPISVAEQTWSKITINILLDVLAIIVCSIVIYQTLNLNLFDVVMILMVSILISVGHIFWSIELDILNPKIQNYLNSENNVENSNFMKCIIIGLVSAIIISGYTLLLFTEDQSTTWIRIIAMATAYFIIRLYYFINRQKVYFKEIQM